MSSNLDFLEMLDENIWMNVLRLFIATNTLLTNTFLIYLFARFSELRKHLCNKLIQLNAIMDLICGFGPFLRAIFQIYTAGAQIKEFSKLTCIFICFPFVFGLSASQITFIAIAIDRLKAIASPFGYMDHKRNKFAFLAGFFAILVGTISMVMVFIGLNVNISSPQCSIAINSGPYYPKYWINLMGICTLIIFSNYIGILIFFFKQKSANIQNHSFSNNKMQQEIKTKQQMKLTKTIALILLIYTISWGIPTFVLIIFLFLDPTNTMRMNYVSYIQGYVTAGGCGLNLYIYLFKHAEIRQCTLKLIGYKRKEVTNDVKKWAINPQIQQNSTNPH